jgi:hypothetical protein
MFRPESMHFPLGSPLISVEALAALRDLIGTLRTPVSCDMPSLSQPPREGVAEAMMPTNMQFNLPLLDVPAAALPVNKRRELGLNRGDKRRWRKHRHKEREMNPKLTSDRLRRRAVIDIRQSSPGETKHNHESQASAIWPYRSSSRVGLSRGHHN